MNGINDVVLQNLLWTLGVMTVVIVTKNLILKGLHKRIESQEIYFKTKRAINGIAFLILLFGIVFIWIETSGSFITVIGLFSAGLALALKDILLNIAGWLYIMLRQPFYVGDRIEISGIKGDVIDQNIFKFRVIEIGNWVHAEQSTGRIIHIPNYKIFTEPLANYTLGFDYIWNEIGVLVPFESDWKKAKKIMYEVLHQLTDDLSIDMQQQIKRTSRKYMVYFHNLTPIIYTDVTDSGVRLTMRFICKPKQRRTIDEKIWEELLDRFEAEPDVDFGYPTMRRT
jgi:small-conductance mechanosensitive channel